MTDPLPAPGDTGGWIAGALAAAGGIWLALRKLRLAWSSDAVTLAQIEAQRAHVELLRTELERMGVQNAALAGELNLMQRQVLDLNAQVRQLSAERQALSEECQLLLAQISMLRSALQSVTPSTQQVLPLAPKGDHP